MSSVELEGPRPRMFKLAVASEVETFKASSLVKSSLDAKDGFVHLSDCNGARVVAKLFFKDATDLQIFEVDESKLQGPVNWIVGKMGDEPPDAARLDAAERQAISCQSLRPLRRSIICFRMAVCTCTLLRV
eukprot:gnl/TRDRNA2_/TRDRNA2_46608_c0_seq1.p2 gnl/TRDRNA2_/TRDRNA2_46608_c0~~gnl/TRDRNA2_/TRDRNA2_46608_c0_seq1.p2  ORF type:complete len:131 (-),score=27.71 gnl/TRDRNA2_/TRDRNA2_46608_c0_seq1:131-523(-)